MSPLEQALWRDFLGRHCGQSFADDRLRRLLPGLWARVQARGLSSYNDYYHHVAFSPEGGDERAVLVESVLNKDTSFFRHAASFRALAEEVLPRALETKGSVALWSAGCSTGQEAYSLAMAALETGGAGRAAVTATDLSEAALARARRGRYRPHEVRSLPAHLRAKYLTSSEDRGRVVHEVAGEVRALVNFRPFRLERPDSYGVAGQDVIFCQNVLIYFRPECRAEIVARLCERLAPGGHLFLGPADALGLRPPGAEPVRLGDAAAFRRRG